MAALIPATSNVEAAYEDMFKEITRKLYGEETGNGLHTLGTPVAQVATTGPTAPEGERSFTNLQIDRSSAPTIEYEHNAGAAAANSGGAATGNVATVTAAAVAAAAAMQQQQQQQQSEGSTNIVVGESAAGEHHLSTAFGLAALMQNGFTQNNLQQQQQMSMNVNKSASQANEQRWATTATNVTGAGGANEDVSIATAVNSAGGNQQAVQILHWTSAGKLQNYTNNQQQQQQQQPPQQQLKHKTSPTTTVTNINMNVNSEQNSLLQNSNASSTTAHKNGTGGPRKKATQHINQQQQQNTTPKRYACSHCPYSTDRRDLYTRHENIHKDEKPFQCYACLKQFNRADHVKKHFLRMHRELQYDINKTRRQVNSNTGTGHQQRTSMSSSSASGSPEQKPNIFHAANVQLENAFLQTQRQPTASSLSIAETIEAVATAADTPLVQLKQEKCDDISVNLLTAAGLDTTQPEQTCVKPKREKRFSCCYCSWSGADKWGLKRHLNTHTKPFVCLLCDYKAARSERLATHILKVHNKRACNKCAFLADSQEEYQTHLNEVHLLKMDAISRNTASVAQDFHKAGGVQELKIPANHQLLFNNRLLTQQWTAKEAAALLASLSNNKHTQESQTYFNQLIQQQQQQQQQQLQKQQEKQQNIRKRNHSTGEEDENTPSSASSTTSNDGEMSSAISTTSSSMGSNASIDQRKAMLKFLSNNFNLKENKLKNEINYNNNNNNINNKHIINQVYMNENQENQEQLIESPPASSLKYKNNNNNLQKHKIFHDNNNNNNSSNNKKFRLDLYKDNKENTVVSATIDPNNMTNAAAQVAANYLTALEYQNMNSHKIGTQLENYIKEIINKYYITNDMTSNMLYAQQQQQQQQHQRIDEEEIEEEEPEQTKRKRVLSETEGYIEYLKNKSDITLTITPKLPAATTISTVPPNKRHHQQQSHHRQAVEIIPTTSNKQLKNNNNNNHHHRQHKNQMNNKKKSIGQIATLLPLLADAASKQQYLATPLDFSQKPLTTLTTLNDETTITTIPKSIPSSPTTITKITTTATLATTTDNIVINNSNSKKRKQAQPKKKGRPSPQVILARLRDKYLNRLVKRKLKCLICAQKRNNSQMVFNYHSKATLTLHRLWKHPKKVIKKTFPHQ